MECCVKRLEQDWIGAMQILIIIIIIIIIIVIIIIIIIIIIIQLTRYHFWQLPAFWSCLKPL